LWTQVLKEYDVSDVAGRAMLTQCCETADRISALAEEIERDGNSHPRGSQRSPVLEA
jgi:hypothetical protein